MKITQDGKEIEVFTEEEVQAKNAAVMKEADDAKAALAKANEDLAKAKDKDGNFAELRKQKEAAEERARVAEAEKKVMKDTVIEELSKRQVDEKIKNLSGGDAEVEKKIRFHLDRLKDPASTPEEVEKKLNDAAVLAGVNGKGNALGSAVSSAGGAINYRPFAGEKSLKPELSDMARRMGITDADVEKYFKGK